jgi:hypothetical protein
LFAIWAAYEKQHQAHQIPTLYESVLTFLFKMGWKFIFSTFFKELLCVVMWLKTTSRAKQQNTKEEFCCAHRILDVHYFQFCESWMFIIFQFCFSHGFA